MTITIDVSSRIADWVKKLKPKGIVIDSRRAHSGVLFVALPGGRYDGRNYIEDAVRRGAVGVVLEANDENMAWPSPVPKYLVKGLSKHLGKIASLIYGEPSRHLNVIGVTGTNGKTSCTYWLTQALTACGKKTAMIGTLGNGFPEALEKTRNTTPDAALVHELLARFRAAGAEAVVMEVSSIGLVEGRVEEVVFSTALFTNLTPEHLDYHGTMDAYREAKGRLFGWPGLKHAVVNANYPDGEYMASEAEVSDIPVLRYASAPACQVDLVVGKDDSDDSGLCFEMRADGETVAVKTGITGHFNIENLLGVAGVLLVNNVGLIKAARILSQLTPPPGRMQWLGDKQTPKAIIDYAHTPDALDHVLCTIKAGLAAGRRLFCVFGCGGDRDKEKREPMGALAGRLADRVWVTNDNPRSENPGAIAEQIVQGLKRYQTLWTVELNRSDAIHDAVAAADIGDVVLIAGKGHETHQEIAGKVYPFSDEAVVREALQQYKEGRANDEPLYWALSKIAHIVGGKRLGGDGEVCRVVSDSRIAAANDLFVAIAGTRFDGHDFIEEVLAKNAFALIDEKYAQQFSGRRVIAVSDTVKALGVLAKAWRQFCNPTVILVVGSNGKTTVKEMIAHLLRRRYGADKVLATQGNLNNAIGLPLTLLRLRTQHRFAVVELGINHPGETAALADCVQPDVVVINNAQREHQEFLKNIETVAWEHSEALGAMRNHGIAVFYADNDYAQIWREQAERLRLRVFCFGSGTDTATVFGKFLPRENGIDINVVSHVCGHKEQEYFFLPVPGEAMALNALAALTAVTALGEPLSDAVRAFADFQPLSGRLSMRRTTSGLSIIDDTYNANPDSTREAINVLMQQNGQRWLIFGDMGEVGEQGAVFHEEIGHYAKALGVNRLLTVGVLSEHAARAFGEGARHYHDKASLMAALGKMPEQNKAVTLLVKGSRFMKMEEVVESLTSGKVKEKEMKGEVCCSG